MEKMGAGEDNGGSGQDLILRPFLSIFLLFPVFFSLAVEGGAAFFNLRSLWRCSCGAKPAKTLFETRCIQHKC